MKSKSLIILTAVVAAFALYIFVFERHQPTTEERKEQADKVLPGFDRDQVQTIQITSESGPLRLERSNTDWHIVEPIDFPADQSSVGSLLSSLENLTTDRRLESKDLDLDAYGLIEPELSVNLTFEDGEQSTISVGAELPLGSKRPVRTSGDEVMVVAGWFVDTLNKPVDDWRSKSLISLTPSEVVSLQVETNSGTVNVVQINDEWRLLDPVDDLADREHMRNLISDLNAVEIKEYVDKNAGIEEMGLDTPRYRITASPGAEKDPIILEMGVTREVDGSTQVACRRNNIYLFWVSDRAETGLGKAPVRWREPVAYPFDSWNCEGIEIKTETGVVSISRQDGLWRHDDGSDANSGEVLSRLDKLAELRAVDFDLVSASPGTLGSVTLTLKGADQDDPPLEVVYTFERPLTEGGNAGLKVSARDTLMSVDPAEVSAILDNLEALQPLPVAQVSEEEDAGSVN
jgi:hypothetical protein